MIGMSPELQLKTKSEIIVKVPDETTSTRLLNMKTLGYLRRTEANITSA